MCWIVFKSFSIHPALLVPTKMFPFSHFHFSILHNLNNIVYHEHLIRTIVCVCRTNKNKQNPKRIKQM